MGIDAELGREVAGGPSGGVGVANLGRELVREHGARASGAGIKRFQAILASAKARDIGEADTVTIVTDMLAEVFGYDKYSEITSEYAIKSTYCDLATKIDGAIQSIIEVKAIGLDLKDQHVKQAIDYADNQRVDWVALTNGVVWRVYKVLFAKPINFEMVISTILIGLRISRLSVRGMAPANTATMLGNGQDIAEVGVTVDAEGD